MHYGSITKLLLLGIFAIAEANAGDAPAGNADTAGTAGTADSLAAKVLNRPANEGRVGAMHFTLVDGRGRERKRSAVLIHSEQRDTIKIAIQFTAPAAIRDTGFLSHDHRRADDQNWLYLPVTDRVRRIPSADRGDPFMGTDLSYGDVKGDFKFELTDWTFSTDASIPNPGSSTDAGLLPLAGTARSDAIAAELGYRRFTALIDPRSLYPREIHYFDLHNKPLKQVLVHQLQLIGGAWTAMQFTVKNLQSGHRTEVRLTDMQHVPALDPFYLTQDALAAGAATLAELGSTGQ